MNELTLWLNSLPLLERLVEVCLIPSTEAVERVFYEVLIALGSRSCEITIDKAIDPIFRGLYQSSRENPNASYALTEESENAILVRLAKLIVSAPPEQQSRLVVQLEQRSVGDEGRRRFDDWQASADKALAVKLKNEWFRQGYAQLDASGRSLFLLRLEELCKPAS